MDPCVSCVTALSDIVALPETLSRLVLPYGASLSTRKSPWKRAPTVTSVRFLPWAGRKSPWPGHKLLWAGHKLLRVGHGWVPKSSSPPFRSLFQVMIGSAM